MQDEINKAITVLENGGIILYPTDTIWGLGCDATNETLILPEVEARRVLDGGTATVGTCIKE